MKQSKNPLVVVGSVAFDTIKTPFGKVHKALGGSAVYFSCAARFFCPVHIVGVVGTDYASKYIQKLNRLGIHTEGLQKRPGKTFHWKGYYEGDLNHAITQRTDLNVFAEFRPHLNGMQAKTPYLFLANIDPQLQWNVLQQVKKPRWIASDTMNFWITHSKAKLIKVLKHVDISLMNDAEIKQLTGEEQLLKAVRRVMKLGPEVVVVKRGEYGAWCFTKEGHFALPAFLLDQVKDPTGAGDAFAGGFLGYLTRTSRPRFKHIKEAAVYGSVLASFNVQSFSIHKLASLTPRDIKSRIQQYKKMIATFV